MAKKANQAAAAPHCHIHGVTLVCPKCQSGKGGKKTARRHGKNKLSEWGKMGGRGHKKLAP